MTPTNPLRLGWAALVVASSVLLFGRSSRADVEWRFDVGSRVLAAPAVAPNGTVYVGTGDGVVQAIAGTGVLRWSHMVEGAVAWAPVVGADGRIYVATAAKRLYSFGPGGLAWQVRVPSHVQTELALMPPWGVVFGASGPSVWAYSARGAALWHTDLSGLLTAGPVAVGKHALVATGGGDLWLLEGAVKRPLARLGEEIRSIGGVFADGSCVVIAGHTLYRLDAKGELRFRRDGVEWASSDGDVTLAIDSRGALVRLGDDGAELSRAPLGAMASEAPVPAPTGEIYVPLESGELAVVGVEGAIRRVPIARVALRRPTLDVTRHRVIVAASSGVVAAVTPSEQ